MIIVVLTVNRITKEVSGFFFRNAPELMFDKSAVFINLSSLRFRKTALMY